MKKPIWIAAFGLVAAACSPETPAPATTPAPETAAPPASMADMPMPAATPTTGPITGTGKIIAVDAVTGGVTLDHQAIPEVKWDAMTMGFTVADPAMLEDLKVGDMVSFDLQSATEPTKISRIAKQ